MHRVSVVLALLVTVAWAAPARADDITVTSAHGKPLAGAFVRLVRPKGWSSSVKRGHPIEDEVKHRTSIAAGGECTVMVRVLAHTQSSPFRPVRTLRVPDARVPVVRRGTRGSVHWAIGDQRAALREGHGGFGPPPSPAAAWLSTPRRLMPAGARAVRVRVEVTRELDRFGPPGPEGIPALEPTRRQKAICARRQSDATTKLLPRALGALRLVAT